MADPDRPIVIGWLGAYPEQWRVRMREAVAQLGDPVLGLAGPLATAGAISMHASAPAKPALALRYAAGDRWIEVTTATQPMGGNVLLVPELLRCAANGLRPPFTLSVEERLVQIPVMGVSTQFRVLACSSGDWVAVGGLRKRHLKLVGSPGTEIDSVELVAVILP